MLVYIRPAKTIFVLNIAYKGIPAVEGQRRSNHSRAAIRGIRLIRKTCLIAELVGNRIGPPEIRVTERGGCGLVVFVHGSKLDASGAVPGHGPGKTQGLADAGGKSHLAVSVVRRTIVVCC